jgi:hypothetical protein
MQSKSAVFNFHLPRPVRQALQDLAGETGLSSADLVRLGISRVLAEKDTLPKLPAANSQ